MNTLYNRYKIPENLLSFYPKLPYHNLAHTQSFDYDNCPSDEAFWAAVFHDIVYDPFAQDNVEQSIKFFKKWYKENGPSAPCDVNRVEHLIHSTKDHVKSFDDEDIDMVWLHKNDLKCFRVERNGLSIAENEKMIFREYQWNDFYKVYKPRRQAILAHYQKHPLVSVSKIDRIIAYLDVWEPSHAVFCGSFDPFHKGHYDVLLQAEKVFDKVILSQGHNEDKNDAEYSLDDVPVLRYHEKVKYEGSLFTFLDWKKKELRNLTIVRGLRNYHDLHDESGLFNFANDYTDVPFAYFISKSENLHISSGAIRKLTNLGKDVSSYLP